MQVFNRSNSDRIPAQSSVSTYFLHLAVGHHGDNNGCIIFSLLMCSQNFVNKTQCNLLIFIQSSGMGRGNCIAETLHTSLSTKSTESKFLEKLAQGQEGGPQAKLTGAYCGIFKDRYSPQTKSIFSPGPYPISFQGGPQNEIKNRVKNQV